MSNTVLILGASRGIGLGLVREYLALGWSVIATHRIDALSSDLAAAAEASNGKLRLETLDINEPDQISRLRTRLNDVSLNLLIVNAGVSDDPAQTIGQISTEEFSRLMVTNALSPLRAIERLADVVQPTGTIAALSSALGSIASNTDGGYEAYRASKAALNMLLRSYVARAGGQRTFLALMPGWVKTDMGGADAPVEIKDSVAGLAATIGKHSGQPGIAFVDFKDTTILW